MYTNQKFANSLDWTMLEIKLPREIHKSPLAAEVALSSLLQSGGVGNIYAREFEGKLPNYFSLEIASLEGVVHFYIRTQKKFRSVIESNFYAQYPGIEIVEAEDYTKQIRYHHLSKDVSLWGLNYRPNGKWTPTDPETGKGFIKKKDKKIYEMKADFLPLKTYVDYGLDKDPKEEFKVDPLTPLLEMMGAIGKGEYLWYQVLVQDESVHDDKKFKKFYVNEETHEHLSLKDMAVLYKKNVRTAGWTIKGKNKVDEFGVPTVVDSYDDKLQQQFDVEVDKDGKETRKPKKVLATYLETKSVPKKEMDLTADEKDELEAINKKFSKSLALAVIRLVYVTKKENFDASYITNTLSFSKPFNGANSLIPAKVTDPYDYPWQKLGNKRVCWRSEETFEAYVERAGFFPHIPERKELDKWEDIFFWAATMRTRKTFRMFYEAIFFPFSHPSPEDVVFTANLEELATLWHLPGAVATTPTLPRIDSTKGVAPVNLPL